MSQWCQEDQQNEILPINNSQQQFPSEKKKKPGFFKENENWVAGESDHAQIYTTD